MIHQHGFRRRSKTDGFYQSAKEGPCIHAGDSGKPSGATQDQMRYRNIFRNFSLSFIYDSRR
jgi:hypothetical protein